MQSASLTAIFGTNTPLQGASHGYTTSRQFVWVAMCKYGRSIEGNYSLGQSLRREHEFALFSGAMMEMALPPSFCDGSSRTAMNRSPMKAWQVGRWATGGTGLRFEVISPWDKASLAPAQQFQNQRRRMHELGPCKVAPIDASSEGLPVAEGGELGLGFALHALMEESGLSTANARAARCGFVREIRKVRGFRPSDAPSGSQAEINLALAALEVAAEDDAIVSHSPVPLPVDAYLARLDHMANELAGHHLPTEPSERVPEAVFEAMDGYIYGYMGFSRASITGSTDARDFYLNGVLTRKTGTPVMLALIYGELANRLRQQGAIDFSVEMELPLDPVSLPHPRVARGASEDASSAPQAANSEAAGSSVVLTPQLLLFEVLRALKQLYWPWRWHRGSSGGSGFLEAAAATSQGMGVGMGSSSAVGGSRSGAELAAARAARYRLQRGIWTSTGFGDLRRALAVCERLVLLGLDDREIRDYGVLLFHCGLYQLAHSYLSVYSAKRAVQVKSREGFTFNALELQEDAALASLLERLRLLLVESSWNAAAGQRSPPEPLPDPW